MGMVWEGGKVSIGCGIWIDYRTSTSERRGSATVLIAFFCLSSFVDELVLRWCVPVVGCLDCGLRSDCGVYMDKKREEKSESTTRMSKSEEWFLIEPIANEDDTPFTSTISL